ncbi:prolyl oligopeptidase family serine peptidase [Acetobacter musti]|uniref:Prolyl oligopeptidase family serine peptidase n=1 Tax=Acetobacter musti TaxID=864732 RepID=A0ABX0JPL9_9PROT|nr:prolyl oligopeptidase family serine peptidase [Acetobacter musti]NHN85019.1 prolyl oligopeptidase family serine peptidase [Acetobacter musti]
MSVPRVVALAVLAFQMTSVVTTRAAPAPANEAPDYLSDIHGAEALDWVMAHNRKTFDALQSDPRYSGFYADALAVGQSQDRLAKPRFLGKNIWNFWQDERHPRGIWRQTTLASYRQQLTGWVTKLDVDALAKQDHENWVFKGANCLEPKERYCLVSLSDGGEDADTLREYDTQAGLFVLNGFALPRSKQAVGWVNRDTLLVSRDWDGTGATLTASGYPFVVRRVIRGQPTDLAIEIARGEKSDVSVDPVVLTDGDGTQLLLIHREPTFFTSRFAVVESMDIAFHGNGAGQLRWLTLPEHIELHGMLHGRLILSLNEAWTPSGSPQIPSGSLVSVDPHDPGRDAEILYTPGRTEALDEVAVTKDTVVVTYFDNVRGRAMVLRSPSVPRTAPGAAPGTTPGATWSRVVLPLPDMSTVHIADADQNSDAAFLTVEGYIDPPQLWLVGASPAGAEKIRQMPAQFDASALTVEQLWATSSDGTRIPYFLVRPKGMVKDGSHPVLLTAYGGFQASYTPTYAPEIGRLWLAHGGLYAVANIRGGGEFGPAWHEAGRKTHRQRIYDDFAAAGRDLVARGITSVRHLGIRGRSNGGLLMGVEFTEHPELWNAVVIGVPLLDMLHYETMAAGASWADEYGSMSDPAERHFLESISPLQHLKAGVHYPTPFIFTSTTDDRVGPVHARRFAARLEALGAPFYYYEDTEGGHSGTVNAKEVAHERALEAVYLWRQLSGSDISHEDLPSGKP